MILQSRSTGIGSGESTRLILKENLNCAICSCALNEWRHIQVFKQFDFSAFDCSGIFRFQTLSSSGADFLQTANAIEIRNQFVKTDRQVLRLGGLLIYFLSMSVTQP